MLSGRELESNTSAGSTASITSSDSSSSITENKAYIPLMDVQVNEFKDKIAFALVLGMNHFPRLTIDGTCVIKMYKKQALLNERMIVLFTAIRWGWNDYNTSENQRKRILIISCCQVAYDRGFTKFLASSQLSVWNKNLCNNSIRLTI